MLLYALTWPATWLNERALNTSQEKYEQLINEVLNNIVAHGEYECYTQYFPRYLLKCLQSWFSYNGDQLYEQLKHVRNHLCPIDRIIQAIRQNNQNDQQESLDIQAMTKTHLLIKAQNTKRQKIPHPTQSALNEKRLTISEPFSS